MKLTAIAPWFGGKRTLAPLIVEELGEHSAYWEPFCGSMAVLFAKSRSSHETLNDLYTDLINLATVVASPEKGPELYDRLSRSLYFKRSRGKGRYEHDFADDGASLFPEPSDHERLAKLLQRFKHARVLVSYYEDPRLAELYAGWTKRDLSRNKKLHLQNRRDAEPTTAPEVLLINGPSFAKSRDGASP